MFAAQINMVIVSASFLQKLFVIATTIVSILQQLRFVKGFVLHMDYFFPNCMVQVE